MAEHDDTNEKFSRRISLQSASALALDHIPLSVSQLERSKIRAADQSSLRYSGLVRYSVEIQL